MLNSKKKIALLILFVLCIFMGIGYLGYNKSNLNLYKSAIKNDQGKILRTFVDTANEFSGINSGASFGYVEVGTGNATNYGILKCNDEVRCENVFPEQVFKFQQPNQPSPDYAEVDTETGKVISFHRAVPNFAGGEYSQSEIENKARQFLNKVYPEFRTKESSLTFSPGMKGVRLNNGNYFFRWEDNNYKVAGFSIEVQPFVQVGITASGFIFSYDNTLELYPER